MKLDTIQPQRRNANRHTERGMRELEASIQADGMIGAITVAANGEIFDGSARREVIETAGLADAIIVRSDGSKPIIHIREDIATADDPRAIRLGLAANKIAADNLSWDATLLAEIQTQDATLLDGLFSASELDALLAEIAPVIEPGAGGDEFDTTPAEGPTRTQRGDLWQLGNHRLLVDDCTVAGNVARLMDGRKADAVVTDPPYGTGISAPDGIGNSSVPFMLAGDESPELAHRAYQVWRDRALLHVWWGANYYADKLPASSCWLVWDKDHHGMSFADAELAWRNTPGPVRAFRHAWSGFHRASEHGVRRDHPTQKPIALLEWVLTENTMAGNVIVDPFLGSGTTLIAAQRTGRICYGCEISEIYADICIRRWEAETGQTAQKVES